MPSTAYVYFEPNVVVGSERSIGRKPQVEFY